MSTLYYTFLQYSLDSALIIFLLWQLPPLHKPIFSQWLIGFSFLGLSYWFYDLTWLSNAMLRFAYRVLVYTLFLRIVKRREFKLCTYMALFGMNCLSAFQTIFYTPVLSDISKLTYTMVQNPVLDIIICIVIRYSVFCIGFIIIAFKTPIGQIRHITCTEWIMISLASLFGFYAKQILYPIFRNPTSMQPLELSVFIIFLQITLLILLVVFERYICSENIKQELQRQEVANHYQLQNVQVLRESQDELRALHHDMKNHLLTIHNLINCSNDTRLQQYIATLLNDVSSYERIVNTGNDVLNGILTEKIKLAEKLGIQIEIFIDLSQADFLEDFDICTLFGNALDNALEACSCLPENICRRIVLRSQIAANHLKISIINSCSEIGPFINGLPQTTKPDQKSHGIGLRNIQHTLKKYHGTLSLDTSQPEHFVLNMLIPFPEN